MVDLSSTGDAGAAGLGRRNVLAGSGAVVASVLSTEANAQRHHAADGRAALVGQGAAKLPLTLTINGTPMSVEIDPRQSILDLLRETLDLTGTKKGCNQGACGACTILLDGRRVNACLTLAVMHQGAEITTIEGVGSADVPHALQTAFIEHEAFQCGYCTPGQIMSGVACIEEGHTGSVDEIRSWMSGNICRCGAYPGIVAAIADVAGRS